MCLLSDNFTMIFRSGAFPSLNSHCPFPKYMTVDYTGEDEMVHLGILFVLD